MGMDPVESIYALTQAFAKREIYGLTGRIRRAAVSIPANIAKGHSPEHTREFRNFLPFAQGSMTQEPSSRLTPQIDALGKQVRSLRAALAKRIAAQTKEPGR